MLNQDLLSSLAYDQMQSRLFLLNVYRHTQQFSNILVRNVLKSVSKHLHLLQVKLLDQCKYVFS